MSSQRRTGQRAPPTQPTPTRQTREQLFQLVIGMKDGSLEETSVSNSAGDLVLGLCWEVASESQGSRFGRVGKAELQKVEREGKLGWFWSAA